MSQRSVKTCEQGTSTIELAFLAPLLTLFVVGSIDLSTLISERYLLTRTTIRAAELGLSVGERDGSYEYLRSEAAAAADVPVENVTVEYWLECDYVVQPTTTTVCVAPSLPFRYIRITITDEYQPRYLADIIGATVKLVGSSVVRVQ